MEWLRKQIEQRKKTNKKKHVLNDWYSTAELRSENEELDYTLSLIDQIDCKNCKLLKIWVEKQGELEDNIYSCNYMECQNIEKYFCSHFDPK